VAEGIKTSSVVVELAAAYDLKMPISTEVDAVVRAVRTAAQAFRGLRSISPGSESDVIA